MDATGVKEKTAGFQTALEVEQIVRSYGCVPATVAIISGKLCVGISSSQIEWLGSGAKAIKASRRDLSFLISQGLHGGTTVSATMIAAYLAGISLFATGGIGGVHKDVNNTFDISADLRELGRTPVAVVSAGIKSILDIPRTLEYLETEGVGVYTYGPTTDFPSFFTRKTMGHKLQLTSGNLIAVPVPTEHEADPENIALIKNNAMVASQIAVALSGLQKGRAHQGQSARSFSTTSRYYNKNQRDHHTQQVVVIGGINIDITASFCDSHVLPNGDTYPGSIRQSLGGVGRNIADGLARLGQNTVLLSTIGHDSYSNLLEVECSHMDLSHTLRCNDYSSAIYCAILNHEGALINGISDFDIHKKIDRDYLSKHEDVICRAALVIFDGNIPADSMAYLTDICYQHSIPNSIETNPLK
ncbi:hypothetical protein LSH36_45g09018 [Paralvinella palmiformis]|uniref:Carbohydrate kinase PfkB domain-containing protein n=1 Tax=Paralvinella palmiformis TaxID=53620 RepID=A0AAD9K6W6_9ANNE|nr:hypothetical protein LSH36_45g09018 [Paralvinella palmiformis]